MSKKDAIKWYLGVCRDLRKTGQPRHFVKCNQIHLVRLRYNLGFADWKVAELLVRHVMRDGK